MSTARKLAVAAASVALGWAAMEAQSAQAAKITGPTTWNLSFFSEGEQVGSGQFSIEREPFEGTFAEVNTPILVDPDDPPDPRFFTAEPIEIDASDNFHQLTSFSATTIQTSDGVRIGEVSYDLSDGNTFLFLVPPEGDTLPSATGGPRNVSFGDSRFPALSSGQDWFFQEGPFEPVIYNQFRIRDGGSFSEAAATLSQRGTWTAQRVPEPSTMAGTLLAGGTLGAWRLRKRKARAG